MAVFDKRFDREQPIQAAPIIVNRAPKRTVMDDIGISFFNDGVPLQRSAMEIDLGIPFFDNKAINNN